MDLPEETICEISKNLHGKDLLRFIESRKYSIPSTACIEYMCEYNHYPMCSTFEEYLEWDRSSKYDLITYAINMGDQDMLDYYVKLGATPNPETLNIAVLKNDYDLTVYVVEKNEIHFRGDGVKRLVECLKISINNDNAQIYAYLFEFNDYNNNMLPTVVAKKSFNILTYLLELGTIKDWSYALELCIKTRKKEMFEYIVSNTNKYKASRVFTFAFNLGGREDYMLRVIRRVGKVTLRGTLERSLDNPILVKAITGLGIDVKPEMVYQTENPASALILLERLESSEKFNTILRKALNNAIDDPEMYSAILSKYH